MVVRPVPAETKKPLTPSTSGLSNDAVGTMIFLTKPPLASRIEAERSLSYPTSAHEADAIVAAVPADEVTLVE